MTGAAIDPEVVRRRLQHLAKAVPALRRLQGLDVRALESDLHTYWSVAYGLQSCVQVVVDVAAHLVSALGGQVGEGYREQLLQLAALGVLPDEFARRIAPMAGFRNVLVHEYMSVDVGEVHRVLTQNLDDFAAFAGYVEQFLENYEAQTSR